MKVVLVQPPIQDFYDTDVRLQPIGLCYLKAAVTQHLPDVTVILKDYHHGGAAGPCRCPGNWRISQSTMPWRTKRRSRPFISTITSGGPLTLSKRNWLSCNRTWWGFHRCLRRITGKRWKLRYVSRTARRASGHGRFACLGSARVGAVACLRRLCHSRRGRAAVRGATACLQGQQGLAEVPNLGYKRGGQLHFNAIEDNYALDQLPFQT